MDRVADRGMLILIWRLSPSQSFLAHSAMRHNGVCMAISCAHLNRILDTGMLSLRQPYSITIPTGDGRLTTENVYKLHVYLSSAPFKGLRISWGARMRHASSKVLQALCSVCVYCCRVVS